MQTEVEETAEAVPAVGPGDLGPGAAVVPVGQVVVKAAVVLPTTREKSLRKHCHRSC
jgi:hypothetical protein